MKVFWLALALAAAVPAPARALTYRIDPAYSAVAVRVKHLFFFHLTGDFDKIEGTFDYQAGKPEVWAASATVSAASVNTGKPKLDRKLLSPKFLDAGAYPDIRFTSAKVETAKDGKVWMSGTLTVRGVAKPVKFELEEDAPLEPTLDGRVGLSAHAVVDRAAWGIHGGLTVKRAVEVDVLLQGVPTFP